MNTVMTIGGEREVPIARCRGELDVATTPELMSGLIGLLAAAPRAIVVDLVAVTFMDCSAVNALLAVAHICRRARVPLVLYGVKPLTRRLLAGVGLDRAFTIAADERGALALATEPPHDEPAPPRPRLRPIPSR